MLETNGFTSKTRTTAPQRTHDVSLTAILESGIDPLATTAIFVAAFLVLAGQSEVVSTEDIKLGKERLEELPGESGSMTDSVRKAMDEMIENFEKSPMSTRSRPVAVSMTSPETASVKRQVASTLASEIAMKERLEDQNHILMMEPGPQKPIPKPKFIRPPLEEKQKSPFASRFLKKLAMPWKKFSKLS